MKKLLAYSLALIMVICLLASVASAATAPKFTIDDVTASPGQTVTIPVKISGNSGILAAKVTLSIPKTTDGNAVFTVDKIKRGSWADTNVALPNAAAGIYNWANTVDNNTENGEFAVYTVTISTNAQPGKYKLSLKSEDINRGGSDPDHPTALDGATTTAVLTVKTSSGTIVDQFVEQRSDDTTTPEVGSDSSGYTAGEPDDQSGIDPDRFSDGSQNTGADQTTGGQTAGGDQTNQGQDNTGTTQIVIPSDIKENPNKGTSGVSVVTTTGMTTTTDTSSDKKDTSVKTGGIINPYLFVMVALVAVAAIVLTTYSMKKSKR